jgi:hypothetical protein
MTCGFAAFRAQRLCLSGKTPEVFRGYASANMEAQPQIFNELAGKGEAFPHGTRQSRNRS